MYAKINGVGDEHVWFAETVPTARAVYDGWSTIAGIMTVTNKEALHDRMYFRLSGTHVDMNVYYDDFSIEPIPKSCNDLVLNGDFEGGDSSLWRPSDRRYITYDMFEQYGADGSQFSLIIKSWTSNSVRQILDTRCLIEGQEYLISAKLKLLNATDLNQGLECEPSILSVSDKRHCPTTVIRGYGCNGTNLEYRFWNEIDQFQWNPDDFNPYESVLTVGPELALCNVSFISTSIPKPLKFTKQNLTPLFLIIRRLYIWNLDGMMSTLEEIYLLMTCSSCNEQHRPRHLFQHFHPPKEKIQDPRVNQQSKLPHRLQQTFLLVQPLEVLHLS